MLLQRMADGFEELEAVTSRRRMVELVASLLSGAAMDEREPLVFLLLGQLRPPYEGVEIGTGEKLLTTAIAAAYDTTAAAVTRAFKQRGDLGLVAEALSPVRRNARLSVRHAYDALLEVAGESGSGSQARRIARLAALLGRVGPREAKYLVRAAQGRLRIGVGDQTILEAAAVAACGGRDAKPMLEHAYNVRSDLGAVVRIAFEKGIGGLTRIGPQVGVPVRPALAQRLASAQAIIARLGEVQAEPKYDGFRLQLHRDGGRVWAFSRRLENVTGMFPELTAGLLRQLRAKRAILEGEAVVHNPETGEFLPFQITMTRKRKTRITESSERYPLRLFAFDLLYADGRDYLDAPQRERSRRLRALVRGTSDQPIAVTEVLLTSSADELETYFDEMIERGLEGVVAKRPDAPYHAGARGFDWVKLKRAYQSKLRDTVDLVLVGYLRGRGKRASLGIGSLLAAVYDVRHDRFRTVAKIGSGLTEEGWKDLRARLDEHSVAHKPARVDSLIVPDVWTEPALVVEVLADEITRSPSHTCGKTGSEPGYALRFPRMLGGIRTDKSAEDATTEREVLDLYRLQRPARGGKDGVRKRPTRRPAARR